MIPYYDLDPNIRETVAWLAINDFNPSDSGDGETKPPQPGVMAFPHVIMVCAPEKLTAECDRLAALLTDHGITLSNNRPATPEDAAEIGVEWEPLPEGMIWGSVEGSYAPGEPGVIMLAGVNDDVLREAGAFRRMGDKE